LPLSPGTQLGPYEIVGPLGAGGMGEVYRARDARLSRDVAVKALPPGFAQDPERLARFEREARLLASLSHPNVAGIHGVEDVDGVPYLVLEFVEGETLAARLERGPMPIDDAIEVAALIAAGVEAAHESGVIHRDLKPGNVMLTPSGAVKVLDFGLAKSGGAERGSSAPSLTVSPTMTHAATQAGMILGTAAYMSPEQARGKSVDKRSDIWSFGCVLYECLAGRQAFEGETVSDLIARILQSEPDWSALPAGIPPRVRRLLARCLRKDVRERLRDIGEARIVLSAPAEPESRAPRSSRSAGVPWWVVAIGAIAVAAIAVFATLRFGHPVRPGPLRKFDLTAKGMVVSWLVTPRLSPDGARFAYASNNKIWVRELASLAPHAIADIADPGAITWSPDSRELAFGDNRKLWRVSADGGRPTAICEIPGTGHFVGSAWSPSGKIAFAVWRENLYEVAAAGGSPTVLVRVEPATQVDFHNPAWLPNGELLYITHWKDAEDSSGERHHGFTIFDGKTQIAVDGDMGSQDDNPVMTPEGRLLYLRKGATPGVWSQPFDLAKHRTTGDAALVAPDAVSLSVSSDGTLLYVEGSSLGLPKELTWIDRAGKTTGAVGRAHMNLGSPRLSPDGRRVAFSAGDDGNDDVWSLDLASGAETRLTFDASSESAPAWIGSLSRLAFVQRANLRGQIQSINADGSGATRAFAPKENLVSSAGAITISPDGKFALRVIDLRGHGSLQVGPILPDGVLGPLKPALPQDPEPNVNEGKISPDGRLLAYQTLDPGQSDVFLTRFPAGEGRWQIGAEGGSMPRWAQSGRELLYIAGRGSSSRTMVSVTVDPSRDPPLGAFTRLFEIPEGLADEQFDVTPDGQRFLFVRPAGGVDATAQHLVLVQNWSAELEKNGGR